MIQNHCVCFTCKVNLLSVVGLLFCFMHAEALLGQGSGSALHGTVTCTNSTGLAFTGSFSLEMWIKPTATDISTASGSAASLMDMRDFTSRGGYEFRIDKGRLRLILVRGADAQELYTDTANDVLTADVWQHIAVTTSSGTEWVSKIYLNGIEMASKSRVDPEMNASQKDFMIGHSQYVSAFPIDGYFDEVRVWNRALSQAEIQANMCHELIGSESGLEAYWNFDNSAQRDADLTGNGHDGTGSGFIAYRSGAPLGDVSTCAYDSFSSLSLSTPEGDSVTLSSFAGSPDGAHIYRVDESPNVTAAPANMVEISSDHYYGVFFAGGTNPVATLTYNYDTHPEFADEFSLALAQRDANDDADWSDAAADQNSYANTLSFDLAGGEVILGRRSADDSGLVAYYPLDGDADDYSGNNHHATAYNGLVWTNNAGVSGNSCALLDGDDDCIGCGSWFTYPEASASIWFKTDSTQNGGDDYDGTLYLFRARVYGFGIQLNRTEESIGQCTAFNWRSSPEEILTTGFFGGNYNNDQWHFAVLTYDGEKMRCYMDGMLMGEVHPAEEAYSAIKYVNASLIIGADDSASSALACFEGLLDEVRFYNRAITPEEVITLYRSHAPDTDSDNMPDAWETAHGLTVGVDDSGANPDGDPFNNGDEYIADTDPTNSNDYLCITAVSNNSPFTVYFESSLLRNYTLLGCTNLTEGLWTSVTNRMGVGGDDSMTYDSSSPANFYKVRVELP